MVDLSHINTLMEILKKEENVADNKSTKLDVKIDNSFIVDMDYVKSKLYDKDTILIDSRAKNRYLRTRRTC